MLLLEGVGPQLAETLARTGVDAKVGTAHMFPATPRITESLDRA